MSITSREMTRARRDVFDADAVRILSDPKDNRRILLLFIFLRSFFPVLSL